MFEFIIEFIAIIIIVELSSTAGFNLTTPRNSTYVVVILLIILANVCYIASEITEIRRLLRQNLRR